MLSRRSTVAYVNAVGVVALEGGGRAACRSVLGVALEAPHAVPAQTVSKALDTDTESGLTTAEARRRLSLVGPNELTGELPVAPWRRFIAQLASPLVLLLIAATLISFIVWAIERETAIPYEALTIMVIVMANAGLGYFQEARAEAAIAGLRKMTSAQATVLRDSVRIVVPVAEIVPGDVLIVGEGAMVPADARVIHSVSLRTMEAALTGESEPVSKDVEPVAADAATADRSNMLFAGTAVAFGHGRAVVTATGMRAEIGR
ncbi:MAG: P-type ATPase, partial [Burkholderiaceae bacterium]